MIFIVAGIPAQQKQLAQKKATVAQKKTTKARKTTKTKKTVTKKKVTKKKTSGKGKSKQPTVTVKSLQNERAQVQKNIKEQEKKLKANERDVKKRLQNLMVLTNEIADKRKTIDTIQKDISQLDGNIVVLDKQLQTLRKELEVRKERYKKSLRYLHRNRHIQNNIMFVFSASSFKQMYRRMRFVKDYAAYQQAQGEAVMSMKAQVTEAFEDLKSAKRLKDDLLYKGQQEKKSLENKQEEQQRVVSSLKKQQKTIQGIIDQQRKRDADLNARIDKMIAEEIARAKARAEAEAKRKAAAEAARKKAAELAKKKAAAQVAAREHARKVAEAKAREEKAKAAAKAAARKSADERRRAEKAAREAEQARRELERKAKAENEVRERELAKAKKEVTTDYSVSSEDRRLSGNFESNRGRLPMPILGGYKIVHHYGTNTVTDVKGHVTLDKKGIDLKGQPGAQVRCIFDGEVSAVFGYAGTTVVIIRHGGYLSVYCDLATVSVRRGQKVSAHQTIGSVGSNGEMQFQLRRGNTKLNPSQWLRR